MIDQALQHALHLARQIPIELAVLLGLGAAFTAWEAARPVRKDSWRKEVLFNIGVFALLVALKKPLRDLYVGAMQLVGMNELPWVAALRELPAPLRVLLAMLVVDLSLYWIHRAMHASRRLWRAHELHHSVENLNWFTGFRASIPHTAMFAIPQALAFFLFFNANTLEASVAYSLAIGSQLLSHANVHLPVGPLQYLLVTPQSHRVHHAADAKLGATNLAVVLSIWDVLFGTFRHPRALQEGFEVGLGAPYSKRKSLLGLDGEASARLS